MEKEYFVDRDSIVRTIWGKSDTILFIFAGASAEFALNKAVDWLYFTGKLPADPLGRLFSTVSYARAIVFSKKEAALHAIDSMAKIHKQVEDNRGAKIPDWAYRDVLFMLIDYSIRAFEVLERTMSISEKSEVFDVFQRMGTAMGLKGLPHSFDDWTVTRHTHMEQNLQHSTFTDDLFRQYRKHLGPLRYKILVEAQTLVAPPLVQQLLKKDKNPLLRQLLPLYKASKHIKADRLLKGLILPQKYQDQIKALDV